MLNDLRSALLEASELVVDQFHSVPILVRLDLKLVESSCACHNLIRVLCLQFVEELVGVFFVRFEVTHHILVFFEGSFRPLDVCDAFLVILQNEGLMLISLCICVLEQVPVLACIFLDLDGQFFKFFINDFKMGLEFILGLCRLEGLLLFTIRISMLQGGLFGGHALSGLPGFIGIIVLLIRLSFAHAFRLLGQLFVQRGGVGHVRLAREAAEGLDLAPILLPGAALFRVDRGV